MVSTILQENVVKNFFNDLWLGTSLESIKQYCSPSLIVNSVVKNTVGISEKYNIAKCWFNAFSDRRGKVEELYSSDNITLVKWKCLARHQGLFCGLMPTGKEVEYGGTCYYRTQDHLITEFYSISNIKSSLMAMGACPVEVSPSCSIPSSQGSEIMLFIQNFYQNLLTKREIENISLWLSGYSLKESARILNISSRTVEEYRGRAKDKLNIKDKRHLYDLSREQDLLGLYLHIARQLNHAH